MDENDPVILAAKEVAEALSEEPAAKYFLLAAKAMEEDESVKALHDGIEAAQKAMMQAAEHQDDAAFIQAKKQYNALAEEFSSHPVVKNFQTAIEELTPLLEEVEYKLQ
jgi:cell fate (sporulation/competence/biofilm development) regulator YmcA (YheA/YmcA/DUF963 family)